MKRFILILFFVSVPFQLYANGGPVEWTDVTPMSGVSLQQNTDISLLKEDLHIKLLDDLEHYKVDATYTLKNNGDNKILEYGVPITWFSEDQLYLGPEQLAAKLDEGLTKEQENKIADVAKSIKLSVEGKNYTCKPVFKRDLFGKDRDVKKFESDKLIIKSWCVSQIEIPGGKEVKLTLSYKAELDYVDEAYSKSALTYFDDRNLEYLLYPAGYWEGNVGELNIHVDLGEYDGYEKLHFPHEFTKKGNVLSWNFNDVNLKELGDFKVVFSKTLSRAKELMTWNSPGRKYGKVEMFSKASSTYKGKISYESDNMLDGDPDTAWCEGVKGSGYGESIDFISRYGTYADQIERYCTIQGIAITHGYLKSQKVYMLNNRINSIKISDCGDRSPSIEITEKLESISDHNAAVSVVNGGMHNSLDFIRQSDCFRLEIRGIEKGKVDDTCISEVALIVNCG